MLRSNSESLGNHVINPEEEKEMLQWEGFYSGWWKTNNNKYDC